MIALRTTDVIGTKTIAARLAEVSRSGDLIVLSGDMGVGKTAFSQGFASGLRIEEPVTSPTFTLVRSYPVPSQPGRPRIMHHLDVYRLERMNEVADLAIDELMDQRSVTLIEWGDAVLDMLPKSRLEVVLSFGDRDDDRHIEIEAVGSSWASRLDSLAQAWEAWC